MKPQDRLNKLQAKITETTSKLIHNFSSAPHADHGTVDQVEDVPTLPFSQRIIVSGDHLLTEGELRIVSTLHQRYHNNNSIPTATSSPIKSTPGAPPVVLEQFGVWLQAQSVLPAQCSLNKPCQWAYQELSSHGCYKIYCCRACPE